MQIKYKTTSEGRVEKGRREREAQEKAIWHQRRGAPKGGGEPSADWEPDRRAAGKRLAATMRRAKGKKQGG